MKFDILVNQIMNISSKELFQILNSKNAVVISGFMLGFLYDFKLNKNTLEYPLSTILGSAVSGFFSSIGASVVGAFLPEKLRFIIPSTCFIACIYYKLNEFKKKK